MLDGFCPKCTEEQEAETDKEDKDDKGDSRAKKNILHRKDSKMDDMGSGTRTIGRRATS